jgi:type IV secretion system protein VirD4
MSKEFKIRLFVYEAVLILLILFLATSLAVSMEKSSKTAKNGIGYITTLADNFPSRIAHPIQNLGLIIKYKSIQQKYYNNLKYGLLVMLCLIGFIEIKIRSEHREYKDIEHGSSSWAKGEEYEILNKNNGMIFGVGKYLDIDSRFINKNVLIFGGAGSRKSRGYVMPNILQTLGSYIITDPKGELYDTTAGFLKANGYDVKVVNLVNPDASDTYNPLAHVKTNIDVDILSHAIIENTSGGSKSNDPFWEHAETALLNACIYYVLAKRPPEEQSFASILSMVRAGADFDLMDSLFMELPFEHMGRKNYETFRLAVDKTRASVLIGLATRLNPFDTPDIASLMSSNNIDIEGLGKRKSAIYCITPDSHSTFNFIATMFFGQVLQRLYDVADKNGGSLSVPVFFLLDEFANTGRIPEFNQKISTSRSRKINISIILQSLDQLIDLYKDTYENIVSNCDTQVFLGSQAIKTCEYISKSLGEATIYKKTESLNSPQTTPLSMFSGKSENMSMTKSDQSMGRSLMTVDELKRLDLWTEIIVIKGMNPIKCRKFDIAEHARYKECEANKTSHNEIKADSRGVWRIYNPYEANQEQAADEEISEEELEKRFDELFNIV